MRACCGKTQKVRSQFHYSPTQHWHNVVTWHDTQTTVLNVMNDSLSKAH